MASVRAGPVMERAHKIAAPVCGTLALYLEAKRPPRLAEVVALRDALRAAADELDRLFSKEVKPGKPTVHLPKKRV